ncbi:hypothetical protein DMC30DRAFT_445069 [Rhodotorula diobovata]|uniref:Oxidoreductase-like domain-containing protein n=1 Tax=Rhodotorula diobovata TaxID=5288 RepID=A0A5C5G0J4_9BASI|nr:hypothetical protein DMC30DRAFT_445069 [Rhodotorula diobovata]
MTRPTPLLRVRPPLLRLSPSGKWLPSSTPLNLDRHPRRAPPPPPPAPPPPPRFDTLASDATAAPSLQAVPNPRQDPGGARSAQPLASASASTSSPAPSGARGALISQPTRVLGVDLPLKPSPPEPDGARAQCPHKSDSPPPLPPYDDKKKECCMSGCATCVYDLYLEDLEHFHSAATTARGAVLERVRGAADDGRHPALALALGGAPPGWRDDVLGPWEDARREVAAGARAEGGAYPEAPAEREEREREARVRAERELKRARDQLDPSMRAFLEMEARMKAKQRSRDSTASASPASTPAPGSASLSSAPPGG